jgi:hypothetical protein
VIARSPSDVLRGRVRPERARTAAAEAGCIDLPTASASWSAPCCARPAASAAAAAPLATPGEKAAADAAADRIRARLGAAGSEAPEEISFSIPDTWSRQLFIALCRRYGISPFRYRRMHRQTVIVKAPRSFIEQVMCPEFRELSGALSAWLSR